MDPKTAIALQIADQLKKNNTLNLNFICTHNSRRSQFAQAWSHVLAEEFQLPIYSFSGGTEQTACNLRTINSLIRSGFQLVHQTTGDNPEFHLLWNSGTPLTLFSKLYDDPTNPKEHFFAMMTCSDADENCPFIPGTIQRIPFRYQDPKYADDTSLENEAYDACSEKIRSDLKEIFQLVKEQL